MSTKSVPYRLTAEKSASLVRASIKTEARREVNSVN
jgi:hypothetical protein